MVKAALGFYGQSRYLAHTCDRYISYLQMKVKETYKTIRIRQVLLDSVVDRRNIWLKADRFSQLQDTNTQDVQSSFSYTLNSRRVLSI